METDQHHAWLSDEGKLSVFFGTNFQRLHAAINGSDGSVPCQPLASPVSHMHFRGSPDHRLDRCAILHMTLAVDKFWLDSMAVRVLHLTHRCSTVSMLFSRLIKYIDLVLGLESYRRYVGVYLTCGGKSDLLYGICACLR